MKQRLYPTAGVAATFREWCGQERLLYNMAVEQYELAFSHRAYAAHPDEAVKTRLHWPSHGERDQQLTELRAMAAGDPELSWLLACPRKVQTQALRLVDQAYKNWWKRPDHFRRPTYRKRSGTQGFSMVGRGADFDVRRINRKWGETRLPKVGWVRFRLTHPWHRLEGVKSCRVTLDGSGRWHISFPGPQPEVEHTPTGAVVGLDMGVVATVTTSDGGQLSMPQLLTPEQVRRRKLLQRKLARQQKGSRRRNRTKLAMARLYATEADRRRDWVEKTSTALVRDHDVVVVEDLKVKNMVRRAKPKPDPIHPGTFLPNGASAKTGLNRSIHHHSWGAFRTRLTQKAEASGVEVLVVNPAFTSQRCSVCGHTDKKNRESQAVFSCRSCNHTDNADANAAANILAAGLAVTGRGGEPHRPRMGPGASDPLKRQPLARVAA